MSPQPAQLDPATAGQDPQASVVAPPQGQPSTIPTDQGVIPNPANPQAWWQHIQQSSQGMDSWSNEAILKHVEAHLKLYKRVDDVRWAKHKMAQGQLSQMDQQAAQDRQTMNVQQRGEALQQKVRVAGARLPDFQQEYDAEMKLLLQEGMSPEQGAGIRDSMRRIDQMGRMFDTAQQEIGGAVDTAMAGETLQSPGPDWQDPRAGPIGGVAGAVGKVADFFGSPVQSARGVGEGALKGLSEVYDLVRPYPKGQPHDPSVEITAQGRAIQAARNKSKELTDRYYGPGNTGPMPMSKEAFQGAMADAIANVVEKKVGNKTLGREFSQRVGEAVGFVPEFGAMVKLGQTAVKGLKVFTKGEKLLGLGGEVLGATEKLSMTGRVIANMAIPASLGYAAGYAKPLEPEDQLRVDQAAPDRKNATEQALRLRSGVTEGAMIPFYALLGGGVANALPRSPILRGLAAGSIMPAASEMADQSLKLLSTRYGMGPPELADLFAAQGFTGPIDRLMHAKDGAERWAAAKEYAEKAAPGMVAFAALGVMERIGAKFGTRAEALAAAREATDEAQAKIGDTYPLGDEIKKQVMATMEKVAPSKKEDQSRINDQRLQEQVGRQEAELQMTERAEVSHLLPDHEGETIKQKQIVVDAKLAELERIESPTAAQQAELSALQDEHTGLSWLLNAVRGEDPVTRQKSRERAVQLFQTAKETRATAPREAGAQTPIDAPDAGAPPEAAPTTELVRQRPTLESTPATQQAAAASQIQTEVTGEQQAGRMAEAALQEQVGTFDVQEHNPERNTVKLQNNETGKAFWVTRDAFERKYQDKLAVPPAPGDGKRVIQGAADRSLTDDRFTRPVQEAGPAEAAATPEAVGGRAAPPEVQGERALAEPTGGSPAGSPATGGVWRQHQGLVDPQLDAARDVVTSQDTTSPGMLRKAIGIGHARAQRVLQVLEQEGVVGPAGDKGIRHVLKTQTQTRAVARLTLQDETTTPPAAPRPSDSDEKLAPTRSPMQPPVKPRVPKGPKGLANPLNAPRDVVKAVKDELRSAQFKASTKEHGATVAVEESYQRAWRAANPEQGREFDGTELQNYLRGLRLMWDVTKDEMLETPAALDEFITGNRDLLTGLEGGFIEHLEGGKQFFADLTGEWLKRHGTSMNAGLPIIGGAVQDFIQFLRSPKRGIQDVWMDTQSHGMRTKVRWLDNLRSSTGRFGGAWAVSLGRAVELMRRDTKMHTGLIVSMAKRFGVRIHGPEDTRLRLMMESASRHANGPHLLPEEAGAWEGSTPDQRMIVDVLRSTLDKAHAGMAERTVLSVRRRELIRDLQRGTDEKDASVQAAKRAVQDAQDKVAMSRAKAGLKRASKSLDKHLERIQQYEHDQSKFVASWGRKGRALTEDEAKAWPSMAETERREFVKTVRDFMPHIPLREMADVASKTKSSPMEWVDSMPAMLQSRHAKHRGGGLELAGNRDPSALNSLYWYFKEVTPKVHMIDWLHNNADSLRGQARPLTAKEVFGGDRNQIVYYRDQLTSNKPVYSHGLHYELPTEGGKVYVRKPPKDMAPEDVKQLKRVVLLETTIQKADRLKWHPENPGWVDSTVGVAKTTIGRMRYRATIREGGILQVLGADHKKWQQLTNWIWRDVFHGIRRMAGDDPGTRMVKVPGLGERELPTVKRMLERAGATLRHMLGTMTMAAFNPIAAAHQVMQATFLNSLVIGPERALLYASLPLELGHAVRSYYRQHDVPILLQMLKGTKLGEGGLLNMKAIAEVIGDPKNRPDNAKSLGQVQSALDAIFAAKPKSKREQWKAEAFTDFLMSPFGTSSRVAGFLDPTAGPRYGRSVLKGPVGRAGDLLRTGQWSLFDAADVNAKTHLWLALHMDTREMGMTREQAAARADAGTMSSHGLFNEATKSPFNQNAMGSIVAFLSGWMQHSVGTTIRILAGGRGERMNQKTGPVDKKPSIPRGLATVYRQTLYMAAMASLAQAFLNKDVSRLVGATVGGNPIPGSDEADALIRGIGIGTESDPRGVEKKALIRGPIGEGREALARWMESWSDRIGFSQRLGSAFANVTRVALGDFSKWKGEFPIPILPGTFSGPAIIMGEKALAWGKAAMSGDEKQIDMAKDQFFRQFMTWGPREWMRMFGTTESPEHPGWFLTKEMFTGRTLQDIWGSGLLRGFLDLFGPDLNEQERWTDHRHEARRTDMIKSASRNASYGFEGTLREIDAMERTPQEHRDQTQIANLYRMRNDELLAVANQHGYTRNEAIAYMHRIRDSLKLDDRTGRVRDIVSAFDSSERVHLFAKALDDTTLPFTQNEASEVLRLLVGRTGSAHQWVMGLPTDARQELRTAWDRSTIRWSGPVKTRVR